MAMLEPREDQFQPNWAVHPGEVLDEYIESSGLTQAEFARRADLSSKLVNTIIKGSNPVEADTAVKLERVTGMKAYIWTGLQKDWELHRSREREAQRTRVEQVQKWVTRFPVSDLQKLGVIPKTPDVLVLRECLLKFFRVANEGAYDLFSQKLAVKYRSSRSFQSSHECVHSWLRLASLCAERSDVAPFNKQRLISVLQETRQLTSEPPEVFQPCLTRRLAEAGVAVVVIPPLKGTRLNGAALWYGSDRALVALSLRHKSNDHFWFTLYHEAAHLVLHRRSELFVDDEGGEGDGAETEADAWAENMLVGKDALKNLIAQRPQSKSAVISFAKERDVHPGIVVGMLQHHGVIPWTHMNDLKVRFEFSSDSPICSPEIANNGSDRTTNDGTQFR